MTDHELWDAVSRQDVRAEHLAELDRLADLAEGPDPVPAVLLASALIVGGRDLDRTGHAEAVARLHTAALRALPSSDEANYPYLLECVYAFEGVAFWRTDDLAWVIAGEESNVTCVACVRV